MASAMFGPLPGSLAGDGVNASSATIKLFSDYKIAVFLIVI
jgi:hypothetical protein